MLGKNLVIKSMHTGMRLELKAQKTVTRAKELTLSNLERSKFKGKLPL